MRKIPFSISLLVVLAACSQQQPANDCAYSKGKPVKGLEVVTATAPAGDLTLRSVCFVNNGKKAVTIDAIETSPISVEGTEVWSFQPSSSEMTYCFSFRPSCCNALIVNLLGLILLFHTMGCG